MDTKRNIGSGEDKPDHPGFVEKLADLLDPTPKVSTIDAPEPPREVVPPA